MKTLVDDVFVSECFSAWCFALYRLRGTLSVYSSGSCHILYDVLAVGLAASLIRCGIDGYHVVTSNFSHKAAYFIKLTDNDRAPIYLSRWPARKFCVLSMSASGF